jgi:flagellar motor component MotA
VPTRQTSSSGRSKSPRIQVVLPEGLWERLSAAAEADSRTVSNMAKVLIQQGLSQWEQGANPQSNSERLRNQLERQQQSPLKRLRGLPRRIRLNR